MVARVRRIMRSRVPCRIWMGIFFTWHSSEHDSRLVVKWKPQDELRGAANTVDLRSGGSLAAAHSCCQSPMRSTNQSRIAFRVSGSRSGDRQTGSYWLINIPVRLRRGYSNCGTVVPVNAVGYSRRSRRCQPAVVPRPLPIDFPGCGARASDSEFSYPRHKAGGMERTWI